MQKKTYQTLSLTVQNFDCNDIVTASVQDGVGFSWDSDWNTGDWSVMKE